MHLHSDRVHLEIEGKVVLFQRYSRSTRQRVMPPLGDVFLCHIPTLHASELHPFLRGLSRLKFARNLHLSDTLLPRRINDIHRMVQTDSAMTPWSTVVAIAWQRDTKRSYSRDRGAYIVVIAIDWLGGIS